MLPSLPLFGGESFLDKLLRSQALEGRDSEVRADRAGLHAARNDLPGVISRRPPRSTTTAEGTST